MTHVSVKLLSVTFDVITYLTTCMWHNPSSVMSDQPSPSPARMAVWQRNLIQLNRFTLPDHQGAVFDSVAQPDLALHEFVCSTAAPIQNPHLHSEGRRLPSDLSNKTLLCLFAVESSALSRDHCLYLLSTVVSLPNFKGSYLGR